MTNMIHCAVCGIDAAQKCGGCMNIVYCSKEHQKIHWKSGHKSNCKCYEVVTNDQLGRHMKATRDIKKGEIILRESPLIYGPKTASVPICLGCHCLLKVPQPPQYNYYKCMKCGWPLCSADCENGPIHVEECNLMAERNINVQIDYIAGHNQIQKKHSAYCVILPLRCLLLKKKNPTHYARFAQLEDHLSERINTPLYKILRVNLISFCKSVLKLNDSPCTEEDILRIAARLDTNAFEVRRRNQKLRAVYIDAAMMSHDCISNARHTFDQAMNIIFISKKIIKKGDIIATSYTQPLKSTLMRRANLSMWKCFDCTCLRCKDPSELGLFVGAILCNKCKIGKIVSTEPLNNQANWQCQLCTHEISAKQICWGNEIFQREIENLKRTSPKQFEEFLYRYRNSLHDTNTHMLQIKYALIQLYGNIPGFTLNEMDNDTIIRKIQLCHELLDVADVLDGENSIFRGNLLQNLHQAKEVLINRQSTVRLIIRDVEEEQLYKEYMEILKFEQDM